MEPNVRLVKTYAYDDLLERIVDRGMVLDGMSHLAAIANSKTLSAKMSAEEPDRTRPAAGSIWLPRSLTRTR